MKPVLRHIESLMQRDGRAPWLSLALFLTAGSGFYRMGIYFRNACYRNGVRRIRRLPCKVVSIGNITLGGTGKTPMSIYVASEARRMGLRAAVLSRGYRGSAERCGGIVSDGETIRMDPAEAGDEPYLIASKLRGVPVLVGKDRFRMGRIAVDRFHTEVIVLDDGFQHVALARDLDIVLLDDRRPFGNRHLFPRGLLREPLSALARSDAFILTRTGSPTSTSLDAIRTIARSRPVFTSAHRPGIEAVIGRNRPLSFWNEPRLAPDSAVLDARPAYGFSGISGNTDFHHTIRLLGGNLVGTLEFPDHHAYCGDDIARIRRNALDAGAELLLTTEKDYVRIVHRGYRFPIDLAVVGIETVFAEDTVRFAQFLEARLLPKTERTK